MMPMEPDREEQAPPVPLAIDLPAYRWYHKMAAVLFVSFCLAVGLFLLIFPWTDGWDNNYFSTSIPVWRQYWDNMYVRGAISGLGVVNLYISFVEMFRLRRFAKKPPR
jgi:hypothetical protein